MNKRKAKKELGKIDVRTFSRENLEWLSWWKDKFTDDEIKEFIKRVPDNVFKAHVKEIINSSQATYTEAISAHRTITEQVLRTYQVCIEQLSILIQSDCLDNNQKTIALSMIQETLRTIREIDKDSRHFNFKTMLKWSGLISLVGGAGLFMAKFLPRFLMTSSRFDEQDEDDEEDCA